MITLLVPTAGRPSLRRALDSLLAQSDGDWHAIVIGDGRAPEVPADERIRGLEVPKIGHPGLVRNKALPLVTTPWTGFLDDDDRLTPDYVRRLRAEAAGADVVIFRMSHPQLGVLPREDVVRHGNVGISFAARTELLRETPFRADFVASNEDFELLHDLAVRGARIHFSPCCVYLVRDA
jgi:glycosyltransferase involved in cell wall biosynthesis